MEQRKNKYLVQGSILAVASIITRIIGMLYKIPMTNIIGNEGMAYYNTAYEIYSIVLILSSLSIPLALSKLISAREQNKEYKTSGRIFRITMILACATGGLAALIIWFGAGYFAELTGYPSAKYPLRILAPTLFVVAVLGVLRGFFQGRRTMVPTALSQIIEQIINAVISILASYLLMRSFHDDATQAARGAAGGTLGTLCGAVAGGLFLGFVFYLNKGYVKRKEAQDINSKDESSFVLIKAICLTLFPIILSQTVYQISGILDISIFGNYMESLGVTESQSAVLQEAYTNKYRQLTNVPVAIASALSAAIVPSLTASYQEKNVIDIRKKIHSSIKMNMIIAIPAAVGMGVLGPQLIQLLYKDTTVLSGNLLRIGSIAIVFFAYSTMTNGILQGLGRLRTPVIHAAVSLTIHIGMLYFMLYVLQLSVYALLIGNVSFAFIVCILNWISIQHVAGYKQEIRTSFVLPSIAAGVMGIFTYVIYKVIFMLIPSNLLATVFSMLTAVGIYFVMLFCLKTLTKEELLDYPMGARIYRLCKKLKLMR